MKKAIAVCALLLAAVLLAGCAPVEGEPYPETTVSQTQRDPMSVEDTGTPEEGDALPGEDYDPTLEEDNGSFVSGAVYDDYGRTVYAGATPIPLDPIDMPTATPKPTLAFTYGQVNAESLRLTFEAPAGWIVDTSAANQIVLTDPNAYDGVNATLTVKMSAVPGSYKLSDVRTEVRNALKEIGQYNYSKWSTTELASRTLLKKDGYYADYNGVYYDGTAVHGRVMVALLDNNQIITVHMACPDGYFNSSYKTVLNHFRETLKTMN